MAIAALVLSAVAIVVSVASVAYTRVSAVETRGLRRIEHDRRLEERRPGLSGVVERMGAQTGRLRVTLVSDEPLSGMEVTIPYERGNSIQGVSFKLNIYGTPAPQPGKRTCSGFAYDPYSGQRSGVRPRESVTWAVDLDDKHQDVIRIEATCYGEHGEIWPSVLIEARVEPDVSQTVW
jgi:hypothetical protein